MLIERITSRAAFEALLELKWIKEDEDLKSEHGISFEHASAQEILGILNSIPNRNISFISRDENGEISGFLLSEAMIGENSHCIDRLLIRKDQRKRGFGHGLLTAFVQSDEMQGRNARLVTFENNSDAIRLFEKFGFAQANATSMLGSVYMTRPADALTL